MHRDVQRYYDLFTWLLPLIGVALRSFPLNVFRICWRFLCWYTHYLDFGYCLIVIWHMTCLHLITRDYINVTEIPDFCLHCLWEITVYMMYIFHCIIWFCVVFSLPVVTAITICFLYSHYSYISYLDHQEWIWSFVDYSIDPQMHYTDVRPADAFSSGWGPYDVDYEYVEGFVAPVVNAKISGLIGPFHGFRLENILNRADAELKNLLLPLYPNGPHPWIRRHLSDKTCMVYIQFSSIASATKCFYALDGRTFDGELKLFCGVIHGKSLI
ncbi:unnamed protein product [Caenorhabditis brenneri]